MPGGGFVSHIPLTTRYVPSLSGLDIAVGVTAYQISAATKSLIDATTSGGQRLRNVRRHVRVAVRSASRSVQDARDQGAQIAYGVTHGAVKAIADAGTGTTRQFQAAIRTAITATSEVAGDPVDALAGAIRGAVAGMIEAGYTEVDLPKTVIDQARAVAPELGISETEAMQVAAQAAVEAMGGMPVFEQAEAWDAILRELIAEDGQR